MKAYLVKYVIVNPVGDITYSGTCGINSTPMPLDGADPMTTALYHARTAQTIQERCDQDAGIPAGRVVILAILQATDSAGAR